MANYSHLFTSLKVGELHLAHRIVLAPLTRQRSSQPGDIPNAMNADYYGQRASQGGLLITEATHISRQGKGYPGASGIHSQEQVEGWKLATRAVHEKGGFIFLQLWHVGRISHSSLHPETGLPVSASAIAPAEAWTATTADFKHVPYEIPRALELDELPGIVADYRHAAETRKQRASMAWRFTAPTAISLTSSSKTQPTTAPTPTAAPSRTAPVSFSKSPML